MSDEITLSAEHRALAFLLSCPAWEGLYKAKIAEEVKTMYALLLNPSRTRKAGQPDDYIRGYISALQWAVTWPDQELDLAAQRMLTQQREVEIENEPIVGGSRPPTEEIE